jgi:hypothetical protein
MNPTTSTTALRAARALEDALDDLGVVDAILEPHRETFLPIVNWLEEVRRAVDARVTMMAEVAEVLGRSDA